MVSTANGPRTWEWSEQEEGSTLGSSSERGSIGYEPGSQGLLKAAESSWLDKEAMVLPPGWAVGHQLGMVKTSHIKFSLSHPLVDSGLTLHPWNCATA